MRSLMILGLLVAVSAVGCCKKEEAAPAPAAADDSTGVAECDQYFAKMKECYTKNPVAKASMEGTMSQMREAFKKTAAMPGGKEQLKAQCTQHIQLLGQNPMCK